MDHAGTPRCTLAPLLGLVLGFGCVTTVEPAVETETDSGESEGAASEPGSSGPGPSGSTSGDPGSTGPDPSSGSGASGSCGDGIVDGGEDCDDGSESAACDTDCTVAECGDGLANATAGEQCDGDDLLGATCADEGFDGGSLACDVGCMRDVGGCGFVPETPSLALEFSAIKQFDFTWQAVADATYYELERANAAGEPYEVLTTGLVGESASLTTPLHLHWESFFRLRACNDAGCSPPTPPVGVPTALVEAIGYFKATNTEPSDSFGFAVAVSGDGSTLAVSAVSEDSGSAADPSDDSVADSGAIYIYVDDGGGQWSPQAYIKADIPVGSTFLGGSLALSEDGGTLAAGARNESAAYVFVRFGTGQWAQQERLQGANTTTDDDFGNDVDLSADGNTLVVGAFSESSSLTGIDPVQDNSLAPVAGATYVFVRDEFGAWTQQAYIKASNTGAGDEFGAAVAISDDGDTLAVGAPREDSLATGIDGDQLDDSSTSVGAVYVFGRDGMGQWSQQAYVKASNPNPMDEFHVVALSRDGSVLAVGAPFEDSVAVGLGGDQGNVGPGFDGNRGAVYVFVRDAMDQWSTRSYVKASNTTPATSTRFGGALSLSDDGETLASGAYNEDSDATGVGGDQANEAATNAGAAYLY